MPRKKKATPLENIELAVTYIEDGALHAGVALLRQAADAIEAAARSRDAALVKLIGRVAPKGPKITHGGET